MSSLSRLISPKTVLQELMYVSSECSHCVVKTPANSCKQKQQNTTSNQSFEPRNHEPNLKADYVPLQLADPRIPSPQTQAPARVALGVQAAFPPQVLLHLFLEKKRREKNEKKTLVKMLLMNMRRG